MTFQEIITMRIGIIGAGTWGIALARMLSNSGHRVQHIRIEYNGTGLLAHGPRRTCRI